MNKYATRSYKLLPSGSGKIAAGLAKMCQQGEIGESLFRSGITQESFNLFLVKLARNRFAAGKTDSQAAEAFTVVSGGNASAAQKALATCAIQWEAVNEQGESILDEKTGEPTWEKNQMSVEAYWKSLGGSTGAPNLSALD